jgi:hypothetical protein
LVCTNGRSYRVQQELGASGIAVVFKRNIGEAAVKVEISSRIGRLQGVELDELGFNAHLEAVLAPDSREVVGQLEGLADFV